MNFKNYLVAASSATVLFPSVFAQAEHCTNDTWNKVISRGKVVVGKND